MKPELSREDDETLPKRWKVSDEDKLSYIKPEVGMVGVNTPTASVRNTVLSREVETLPEGWNIEDEREEPSTKPQPHSLPETLARIGLVPLRENQQPATVVRI